VITSRLDLHLPQRCNWLTVKLQKDAIEYSWELLTEVYGLPKDRLYVTYFEGDTQNGLEPDNEARQYWLEQGVADDHILTGSAKDNFWGMLSIQLS
jgi:alanyl-tRNA synthetase